MKTPSRGFTLIEILIALAVFAVIASITSQVLYNSFHTKERLSIEAGRLTDLQLAVSLLNRDFLQVVNLQPKINEQLVFAAFTGDKQNLEMTVDGYLNPGSLDKRSTLTRVSYICSDHTLWRRMWKKLDNPDRDDYIEFKLLDNLKQCNLAYFNKKLSKQTEWQLFDALPKAVEFDLVLNDWGEMNFLFLLTGN